MDRDGNDRVADFIRTLQWDDLPAGVQQQARLCLLDALGETLAGVQTAASRIVADTVANLWRGDAATIFFSGKRARAPGAAFANACAADALERDANASFTRGRLGVGLLSTALAVGEESSASGKTLLEALVIGYEVATRAGRGWHDEHEIYKSGGSWRSLACAAVAARLWGLEHAQVKHALGIADYHAPNANVMRAARDPALVGHAAGWEAMNGVISAELAQRGFTGIPSLLGFDAYRTWVLDIGEKYRMADWAGCDSGIVERSAEKWSQAMVEDKFQRQASRALPSGASVLEAIIKMAQSFEVVADVRYLTCLL